MSETRPYQLVFDRVTGVDWKVIRERDGAQVYRSYSEKDCLRWVREQEAVNA